MSEQRPYRSVSAGADFRRVKLWTWLALAQGIATVNWLITQRTAAMLGYAPWLGASLHIGGWRLYAPLGWLFWWSRFRGDSRLTPLWHADAAAVLYASAVLSTIATLIVVAARWRFERTPADLHGSARWAATADIARAGLIRLKRAVDKAGIYLALWPHRDRLLPIKDSGESHVLVFAPARSGKGVGIVIPTLLRWPHSVIVHDIKGENWAVTAGARRADGHICLRFDPSDATGASVRFNPLAEVRLRTDHEAADVQNIVRMILDPEGRGLYDHWHRTGAALFTGTILHVLYAEQAKTLRGVAGFLNDPAREIDDTIKEMLTSTHDPDGSMGWKDFRGEPTRTHPLIAESCREFLNKAPNERSGVFSTAIAYLDLFKDPIVARNTEVSEFKIADLMNHERPVSLYLVVPVAHSDKMRPLIRLMLNQIVRTLTPPMSYAGGRAKPNYRHPLLLMLDEFPSLRRMEFIADSLAFIPGFGLRACLIAQDITQIWASYGREETITGNCDTRVAFTPNRIETARFLSAMTGETTVRTMHETVSSGGVSLSEPETRRALITPDEVMRLSGDEALVFGSGLPAIKARKLRYFEHAAFSARASIPPPAASDRIDIPPAPDPPKPRPEPAAHKRTRTKSAADQSDLFPGLARNKRSPVL